MTATPPAWVLDLDGVVWLADEPISGAAEAIGMLDRAGLPVVFATNNSSVPVADVEAKLGRHGIPAAGRVVTSAMASALLIEPGERVVVCGGAGLTEAVAARGASVVDEGPSEVVLVGFDRTFTWERLRVAASAIRGGARFVASNDDATYPTPDGPVPGGGAIVAAVATAAGVPPLIAGKPHEAMARLIRQRVGDRGIVVGDRPSTDGAFAVTLGFQFGLVLSGVTTPADLPVEPAPDVVLPDLRAMVAWGLATPGAAPVA